MANYKAFDPIEVIPLTVIVFPFPSKVKFVLVSES